MNSLRQTSIRHKVGKIIAIFSLIIIVFYTGVMAFLLEWGLINGGNGIVWQESRLYARDHKSGLNPELPKGRSLNGYLGIDDVPFELKRIFGEKNLAKPTNKEFINFYKKIETETAFLHHTVSKQKLHNSSTSLYIHNKFILPKDLEFNVWDNMYYTAIAGGVLVVFMLIIFRRLLHQSLNPLSKLSYWLDNLKEDQPPSPLPTDIPNDEIGQVSKSLFSALERISHANDREKQFLRNASHELRTPIAIIRNSLDVVEFKRQNDKCDIDALLTRIRRASDTMKSVTEAILWLATENYSPPARSAVDLKKLTQDVVDDNQTLLASKNIKINLKTDAFEPIDIEEVLLRITYDNLVRNAFQHSSDGEITIRSFEKTGLEITNSHQGFHQSDGELCKTTMQSGGFGLGLALVYKISNKMHWDFSFSIEKEFAIAKLKV